ncbi:xanthine dehydrogenase family protein subunit M [Alkalibaculum bacchi]|uniref:FAD binding domain-containing protein n=1 Tax=Alkalibaculum bacchi TaxID=645887 RepID=UPI0026ED0B57|nr:xanthine dehydrogenase family protein subunit M [Alkalibaculum bacchi]
MRFEKYCQPTTTSECVSLLKTYGSEARMVAGGTDLVPKLKSRAVRVKAVIGLEKIAEAKQIIINEKGLELGALVTLRTVSKSSEIKAKWPALSEAAGHVSSDQIRNIATIGGNVCNASPSADALQGLIVYDAIVNIVGENGTRKVPIVEFFVGPGKTVLEGGEFVISFTVPTPKENSGATYKKFALRGDTDISIVGVGSNIALDADGKVASAIISFAAVAPTPIRSTEAESLIMGKQLTDELIDEAAELIGNNCSPITDHRATKEYRVEMIKVWAKNALKDALARTK